MFDLMIDGGRAHLDKVRVPGILGDAQVVIALLLSKQSATAVAKVISYVACLLRALSEDVTWKC